MHFAVDYPVWVVLANLGNSGADFSEVGVFTAGAVGGIGKHGDAWGGVGVGLESFGGVFDNGDELLGGGLFINAAIGEG